MNQVFLGKDVTEGKRLLTINHGLVKLPGKPLYSLVLLTDGYGRIKCPLSRFPLINGRKVSTLEIKISKILENLKFEISYLKQSKNHIREKTRN